MVDSATVQLWYLLCLWPLAFTVPYVRAERRAHKAYLEAMQAFGHSHELDRTWRERNKALRRANIAVTLAILVIGVQAFALNHFLRP